MVWGCHTAQVVPFVGSLLQHCANIFFINLLSKIFKLFIFRRTFHMFGRSTFAALLFVALVQNICLRCFSWIFTSETMCVKDIFENGNFEIFRLFSRLSGICENLKVMEENWWSDVITSPTNLLKERKIIEHQSPLKLLFSIKIAHLAICSKKIPSAPQFKIFWA